MLFHRSGTLGIYLIVRLDVAESLLRRPFYGIVLTPVQTLDNHAKMKITAMAPDTLEISDIEAVPENSKVEINLPGRRTPYFAGVCTSISLQVEGGLKIVTIEALSWTYLLDITKYNRSYQHLGISYEELLADILKEYPDAKYLVELPPGRQYEKFIVQYWETPWEILKRIAAREGTVLTPEYADADHRPRFWLGLPQTAVQELTISSDKCIVRNNQKYLELAANDFPQVEEQDFVFYQTTGYETLHLGQAVTYDGKRLIVVHIASRLERELLRHTFTLAPAESIALEKPGENTNLKGCALPGTVLERTGVHVKIHLDIDESQDKATAIWFPYSADADSFMYCMPHEGEKINLYFRNGWEAEALAVSGARGNGQSCAKTGDYNHRYFTSHERKEMYMSPDTLSFTADESAASKITIVMTDANGIDIVSAKDIVFAADNDIKIKGKTITLEAGAVGSSPATGAETPGLYISNGLASIVMKDDINNFYGKPVKMEGTNKATCPQPEEVPADEAIEDEEDTLTAEDYAEIGLAVAGFAPSPTISTIAAVGEAGLALKQGDYFGACTSLAGGIPIVGGFVRTAKIVRKGKLFRKIVKALSKGKNVKKLKGPRVKQPRGKMKTKSDRVQANHNKVIKDAAEGIAKKGPSKAKYTSIRFQGTTKVGGEVKDISRRIYQRNDLNWNRIDPETGLTNAQLAKKGRPPYWNDGTKIELHHLTQMEPGSMVEIPASLHDKYSKVLHGLVENGGSFRNNPALEKQYNNFRTQYWRWRAGQL